MHTRRRYSHLTLDDRRKIYVMAGQNKNPAEIASHLGRHRSTIYREISRNRYDDDHDPFCRGYFPVTANDFASARRNGARRKLAGSDDLERYVASRLQAYWSPDQIAGYLRRHPSGFYACPETIYRYIYSPEGKAKGLYRYLFRCRPKRHARFGRKRRTSHIPAENTIHSRSEAINNRTEFGHWEGDLMIFLREHGNTNVTSLIERKSRYMLLAKNHSRASGGVMSGIADRIGKFPRACRRSMTFDRGSEFMAYPLLRDHWGVQSYFCDPRAPWQKGAVENGNGRLRRFLPANTNVATVSDAYLYEICVRMNATPRKCLGYRTPHEVFAEHLQQIPDKVSSDHNLLHFR